MILRCLTPQRVPNITMTCFAGYLDGLGSHLASLLGHRYVSSPTRSVLFCLPGDAVQRSSSRTGPRQSHACAHIVRISTAQTCLHVCNTSMNNTSMVCMLDCSTLPRSSVTSSAGLQACFGAAGLAAFLGSSLASVIVLTSVNYVEHYGLTRKRLPTGQYENVSIHHSWCASPPPLLYPAVECVHPAALAACNTCQFAFSVESH